MGDKDSANEVAKNGTKSDNGENTTTAMKKNKKCSITAPVKKVVTVLAPKEELVASTPNERNWRGMAIALLVIVVVLGLILLSIVLLSPPDDGPRLLGSKLSLEQLAAGLFIPPRLNGSWATETDLVFRDASGGLTLYNAENRSVRVLMTNSTFRQLNAVDYRLSSDLKFVLLISDVRKHYTNTIEARYHIYEVSTQNRFGLGPPGVTLDDGDPPYLQHAVWSTVGHSIVFVHDGDVYYRPSPHKHDAYRITHSGASSPAITNGITDWLYQEEVFKDGAAVWFSRDGTHLAFATFNDTLVGQLKFPVYGPKLLYPIQKTVRYPKPGTANPTVTVYVVNLTALSERKKDNINHFQLRPSENVMSPHRTPYLMSVTWGPGLRIAIVWLSRRQNISTVVICSAPKWVCEDSHVQRGEPGGWLEPGPIIFSRDASSFLTLLPVRDGDAGYYSHLCHMRLDTRQKTPLTHGQLTVTDILAWDHISHVVYFRAAPEGKPGQRHIYRVYDNIDSPENSKWQCLTCQIDVDNSTSTNSTNSTSSNSTIDWEMWPVQSSSCLYVSAMFSPGPRPRFYLLQCLGPGVPSLLLIDTISNTKIATLDLNAVLSERYHAMARPQVKTFSVEVESGFHAQVRLLLPSGLREFEDMAFPLVLHVRGRPGEQTVDEKWRVDWSSYLVSQRNFIVAEVDGRGSPMQGDRMKHAPLNRVGSVDVEDQIAVVTYLRDNLKFVDREKMAVWGEGYGGFATAMILSQDPWLFSCGMAVSPIVSWAHYNSMWTERIMGTPNVTDNYRGYEESDVSKRAGNLRSKPLLLVHGTADERVPYQHSMLLVRALVDVGAMFRHMTYPDEGHDLSGVRTHLQHAMESFLDDCFGPLDFADWEVGTGFFSLRQ